MVEFDSKIPQNFGCPTVHNDWRSQFTCRATWRPLSIWLEPFFPVVVGFCVKPGVVERSCHVFLRSTGNADDRSANFFSPVSFSGRVTEVQEMSRIWVSDVQLPIMQLMPIVKSETGYWRCRGGSSSHHCQYDPQGICKITKVKKSTLAIMALSFETQQLLIATRWYPNPQTPSFLPGHRCRQNPNICRITEGKLSNLNIS